MPDTLVMANVSDQEESRLKCIRHALMAIVMPERFVMAFVSDKKSQDANCKGHALMANCTNNCLELLVLELV